MFQVANVVVTEYDCNDAAEHQTAGYYNNASN